MKIVIITLAPGCLYVSGGAILEDGDGIELVQKFDAKTGHWTEVTGMLIPRSGSAACYLNGYIYVIGKCLVKVYLHNPTDVVRHDTKIGSILFFVSCRRTSRVGSDKFSLIPMSRIVYVNTPFQEQAFVKYTHGGQG
jgi:hypothetical protein